MNLLQEDEALSSKKITVVLFPEGVDRVKQFTISKNFIVFCGFMVLILTTSLFWIIEDYKELKLRTPQFVQLGMENHQLRKHFFRLTGQLSQMAQKMEELKDLDRRLRGMVDLAPTDGKEEKQGIGGSKYDPKYQDYSRIYSPKQLFLVMQNALDDLSEDIVAGKLEKTELHAFFQGRKILLASTPSIWPTSGRLSSKFDYRISPFTGKKEFHDGIDISSKSGTPVVSPADGIVASIRRDRWSGNVLIIRHGFGYKTKYAHLKAIIVKKGQTIKRGEVVALVGNSGRSTGPHLHYEVHFNDVPKNPLHYVPSILPDTRMSGLK